MSDDPKKLSKEALKSGVNNPAMISNKVVSQSLQAGQFGLEELATLSKSSQLPSFKNADTSLWILSQSLRFFGPKVSLDQLVNGVSQIDENTVIPNLHIAFAEIAGEDTALKMLGYDETGKSTKLQAAIQAPSDDKILDPAVFNAGSKEWFEFFGETMFTPYSMQDQSLDNTIYAEQFQHMIGAEGYEIQGIENHEFDTNNETDLYILTNLVLKSIHGAYLNTPYTQAQVLGESRPNYAEKYKIFASDQTTQDDLVSYAQRMDDQHGLFGRWSRMPKSGSTKLLRYVDGTGHNYNADEKTIAPEDLELNIDYHVSNKRYIDQMFGLSRRVSKSINGMSLQDIVEVMDIELTEDNKKYVEDLKKQCEAFAEFGNAINLEPFSDVTKNYGPQFSQEYRTTATGGLNEYWSTEKAELLNGFISNIKALDSKIIDKALKKTEAGLKDADSKIENYETLIRFSGQNLHNEFVDHIESMEDVVYMNTVRLPYIQLEQNRSQFTEYLREHAPAFKGMDVDFLEATWLDDPLTVIAVQSIIEELTTKELRLQQQMQELSVLAEDNTNGSEIDTIMHAQQLEKIEPLNEQYAQELKALESKRKEFENAAGVDLKTLSLIYDQSFSAEDLEKFHAIYQAKTQLGDLYDPNMSADNASILLAKSAIANTAKNYGFGDIDPQNATDEDFERIELKAGYFAKTLLDRHSGKAMALNNGLMLDDIRSAIQAASLTPNQAGQMAAYYLGYPAEEIRDSEFTQEELKILFDNLSQSGPEGQSIAGNLSSRTWLITNMDKGVEHFNQTNEVSEELMSALQALNAGTQPDEIANYAHRLGITPEEAAPMAQTLNGISADLLTLLGNKYTMDGIQAKRAAEMANNPYAQEAAEKRAANAANGLETDSEDATSSTDKTEADQNAEDGADNTNKSKDSDNAADVAIMAQNSVNGGADGNDNANNGSVQSGDNSDTQSNINISFDKNELNQYSAEHNAPIIPDNMMVDDRFFHPGVFAELETKGYVSGSTLAHTDPTGQYSINARYDRETLAQIAVVKFEDHAAEMGIEPKDITKAMFEGRFNPSFDDIELVYEGLSSYEDIDPANHQDFFQGLKDAGVMEQDALLPDRSALGNVLATLRNDKWNARYGSMADMDTVATIIDGQASVRTAQDMAFRHTLRYGYNTVEKALNTMGDLAKDPALTYDDAMKALHGHPALQQTLEDNVNSTLRTQCAFSHFSTDDRNENSKFNLKKDYYMLRNQKYVGQLQNNAVKDLKTREDKRTGFKQNADDHTTPSSAQQTTIKTPEAKPVQTPAG